jgi:hypothetical protein
MHVQVIIRSIASTISDLSWADFNDTGVEYNKCSGQELKNTWYVLIWTWLVFGARKKDSLPHHN